MKRLIAILLCLILLTACGTAAPVAQAPKSEAPVSDVVAPPAPTEGPSEEEVIQLLHIAESIYQPGNYDVLSVISYENYIDELYYDEVGGYEEAAAEIFTQNGVEQLEETLFQEIPLIRKDGDKVYRASAMADSATLRCYELIDSVTLTAQNSGNFFYEITHTPLPKGYTAEEKSKLSTLVSPLTVVWQNGRWKVDYFAAFGQNAIACGTPLAPEVDLGQLPGNISEVPEPTALTEEEIAQVNQAFAPVIDGDTNPLGVFIMNWYKSPAELDLTEFLRYYPDSEDVKDPDEFDALKAHENWNWPEDAKLDMMPVPIHRISADKVDATLQKYMGVGIENITYHPNSELIYLEEYDSYYNFTSDANFGVFECTEGDITGDTLVLSSQRAVLTMKLVGEKWMFHSFTPNFSSLYEPNS
ncbi:MAG: hypothetical protein IKU72_05405 [Oscillospiraceae bacterium]|nr:hypothetical protein [Oscillospiraceae bacterium]